MKVTGIQPINLLPGSVIMGTSKIEAETSLPNASIEQPSLCFLLEISREQAWKVLDKINEEYSLPQLLKEEQKLEGPSLYFGEHGQHVINTLHTIQKLLIKDVIYKDYWINLKIEELVLCCLQTNMREILMIGYHKSQIKDYPLAYAIKYIKENLYSQIDIKTLSNKAFMSKATFYRQFKHHFGMTPVAYIHTERIREAQHLLGKTDKIISEIGYDLGYKSSSYFSLQFERVSGCTPKNYRNSIVNKYLKS